MTNVGPRTQSQIKNMSELSALNASQRQLFVGQFKYQNSAWVVFINILCHIYEIVMLHYLEIE